MRVLGIETSCDETAAAVVENDGTVISNVVHSQISLHAPYGGIVPELASRDHLRNIRPVIEAAVAEAGSMDELGGIAVTCQPGLSGALLVGLQAAQGLGWSRSMPVVGVDHLIGHLLAAYLKFPDCTRQVPELPFVALLASGGHTALYRVDGLSLGRIQELGATRDDAAGEAFDKVAKLLGLGYPGGPTIDRLAREGNADAIDLARPMANRASLEFSFSGLKANVMRWVTHHGLPENDQTLRDLCASFQRRVVETLVRKAMTAVVRERVGTLVLAGGVAANRELRETASNQGARHGVGVILPPIQACTDNAAMIAYAGALRLAEGADDTGHLTISPRTALLRVTRKGRGRRDV